MIILTRKGLTLSISEGMIPARGSQNVPVRYVNDTDEYANYLITPVVGWAERNGLCKSSIAEYSDGIIKLPARTFAQSCMASIAIKMTDPSDPTHVEVTYPQSFFIEEAPDGTLILPPTDEEWKQYIDDFVTQYFDQNIDPEMDEFKAEIIQNQTDFKEQMNEDFNNFIERTDGNPDALYRGYLVSKNNVYSGVASNDGIILGKVVGKSIQNGTPTPDSPVEIKNVEITNLISHRRQLLDASKLPTKSVGGATVTNNDDGSYTVSGSGSLTSNFYLNITLSADETKKLFKVGNLKGKINGNNVYPRLFINFYDKNGLLNSKIIDDTLNYEITQDMFDNGLYVLYGFTGTNGSQIVKGTVKPMLYQDGDGSWEQFQFNEVETNIELLSLPNGVADTYENGIITRRVGVVTFDGSSDENWSLDAFYADCNRFYISVNDLARKADYTSSIICNRLKTIRTHAIKEIGISGYVSVDYYLNQNWIYLNGLNQFSTVEELKTWLQSNPVTVYYDLATPTTEPYTVPTLPSYYPNTVAFHDSEVEPAEIEWHVETEKGYAPPNENLLINPYFQAWQRGASFTLPIASYNGYTADRVYSNASTFGAMKIEKARTDGGLKMTVLKEGYTYAPYNYLMNDYDLTRVRKKQVTLSYSVDGVIHVFTVDNLGFLVIQNDEIYEPSSYDGDDERCQTNKRILTIQWTGLSANETKTFDWIKLEFGDIVTPCIPPSEEENLLDCLPYYQNLGNITCAYIDEVSGKHTFYYLVQGRFHVPMIGVPSITYSKVGDASSGSDLGVSANFSGRVTNEKIRSCQLSSSITNNLITLFDVIAEAEIK